MNILALGAGEIGTAAAKIISDFPQVNALTIADLNLDNAQKAMQKCNNPKVSSCSINVTDFDALTSLMQKHDLVINCVGPFFRFALPTLKAAISAKTTYFDICDDPEPTLEMLKLNQQAQENNITAVIGLGATPGITNVLAGKVFSLFTHTKELHAAWNIEEDNKNDNVLTYSAAILHWMQQCSGNILECRNNEIQLVKPLQKTKISYPHRGTRTLFTVGHPEPIAFKHSYPQLENSSCYMVMPSLTADFFQELAQKIDCNALTLEEAAQILVEQSQSSSFFQELLAKIYAFFDRPKLPRFFVFGKGNIENKIATITASLKSFPENVNLATSVPLAAGVQQFMENKITAKGVLTPEKAIPADDFFKKIAPYCSKPNVINEQDLLDIDIVYN